MAFCGCLLVGTLQQPELVADRDRAFDVQRGKPPVELVEQRCDVEDPRRARDRAVRIERQQRAAAAISLRAGAERQQRAVRETSRTAEAA